MAADHRPVAGVQHPVGFVDPQRRSGGTSARLAHAGRKEVDLEFIMRDYVVHLRHHLDQIL